VIAGELKSVDKVGREALRAELAWEVVWGESLYGPVAVQVLTQAVVV
jgi:hypothetical protein